MTDKDPSSGGTQTGRLSPEQVADIIAEKRGGRPERRMSLLVYHRDGVEVVPLTEGKTVVVGRLPPADVPIRDGSLSRQHAAVCMEEDEVWVEDLQSTNGTWVNGKKVDRCRLDAGAELAFGTVAAGLHGMSPLESHLFGLESHDRFQSNLEAEVSRSHTFGRGLALVMLRGDKRKGGLLSDWLPKVQNALRPFDRTALYSPDTVEILLPETTVPDARAVVESVVKERKGLLSGIGAYPDHAASAGELIEVTRMAMQRASDGYPVEVAPAKTAGEDTLVPRSDGPIISSDAMRSLMKDVKKVAASAIPVLLLGETGTGKEVVARAIHAQSKRKKKPIICVNCGCIPAQLVESTLFGHEKGAFTGANQQHEGVFESADGGAVLLDEIGELPQPAQAALLRVLETKRFARVGSTKEIEVDVRVLAATHRNLEEMCSAGTFREDLYYRLNVMSLAIPPLRERTTEIKELVKHFIKQANKSNDSKVRGVDDDAMLQLVSYGWPGNVRELRNAIERAVVIARDQSIGVEDLPACIRGRAQPAPKGEQAGAPSQGDALADEVNLRAETQRFETDLILRALNATGWKRTEAARLLGLPVRTLSRKIQDYGLKPGS